MISEPTIQCISNFRCTTKHYIFRPFRPCIACQVSRQNLNPLHQAVISNSIKLDFISCSHLIYRCRSNCCRHKSSAKSVKSVRARDGNALESQETFSARSAECVNTEELFHCRKSQMCVWHVRPPNHQPGLSHGRIRSLYV